MSTAPTSTWNLHGINFSIVKINLNNFSIEHLNDFHKWLKDNLIPSKENSNLLDIGCGNGWAIFLAAQKGYKSTGLDWSEEEIKKLKERSELLNLTVNLLKYDARQLDKLKVDKKFDVIINCIRWP